MAPAADRAESLETSLKELKLTNEEMTKFEKAFKDPEFLKLFEEYAKEVSDPKVKAETDQYLRQLEEQGRGEDVYGKGVHLVVPTAAMVLKCKVVSADKSKGSEGSFPVGQKVFINVCTSDKVERYSLKDAKDASGRVGKQLSIPLTLGPKRVGTDKHGQPAAVYDFVVHPDSVDFASKNPAAMNSLAETAMEQVEKVSHSRLSRAWRRLNSRYKATEGATEPPVQCIRTAEGGDSVGGRLKPRADVPGVDVPGAQTAPKPSPEAAGDAVESAGKTEVGGGGAGKRSTFSFGRPKAAQKAPEVKDPAQPGFRHADGSVTPEWSLVHRGEADLAAAWGDAGRGLALTAPHVPKELLVRVGLPEVASAAAVDLDIGERQLDLKVPGRYQLSVPLPYNVDESKGKAKFDKARKQLEVALPVIPPPPPSRPLAAASAESAPPGSSQGSQQPTCTALGGDVEDKDVVRQEPAEMAAATQEKAVSEGVAEVVRQTHADGGDTALAASTNASAGSAGDVSVSSSGCGDRSPGTDVTGTPGTPGLAQENTRGGERQPTENERRWQEIHARQHTPPGAAEQQPHGEHPSAPDGLHADGSGDTATAVATVAVEGAAATAVGKQAPADATPAEPTVMLRPRLRTELAMELD